MLRYKSFLLEYLTDEQSESYKNVKMTPKARAATDPFFGKGNDSVREDIPSYEPDKSEPHRKIEKHLGKTLSVDEYRSGTTTDKYGRQAKIGKMISDPKLRNEFASDSTRAGSKATKQVYVSIHRGVNVAGQTNPQPDSLHPKGHSWANESCKNVTDGSNRRYLKHEIRHGTVVVFGHDHTGREIYRATLHPHHNDQGDTAYAVDAEYGIKHPAFQKHARDVARRLSGEFKPGLFAKHPNVYDDSGNNAMLHPDTKPEHIEEGLKHPDPVVRMQYAEHPNATSDQISRALKDPSSEVREAAIHNPSATSDHIDQALKDSKQVVRRAALENRNVTSTQIDKALKDSNEIIRGAAIKSPNATPDHISKALDDRNVNVRRDAMRHPNATPDNITKALKDSDPVVRITAMRHPNATPDHITKALDDSEENVRRTAIVNPNATRDNITKALKDSDPVVRTRAMRHPNVIPDHITQGLKDSDVGVRATAIQHPHATPDHITQALNDSSATVRWYAAQHPNATPDHINKALKDPDEEVRSAAMKHKNFEL